MKIAIETSSLTGHTFKGIGTYTKLLIDSLKRFDTKNDYIATTTPYACGADIVHLPSFDFFYPTLPLYKPLPTVITIHDTIPLLYPKHYPVGIRGTINHWRQRLSLNSVHHIVTDSDCSTRDVIRYLHQPEKKVSTVHLAPDPSYMPTDQTSIGMTLQKYQLNRPYFLYVGDIYYSKNIEVLIKAYSRVKQNYDLVMVSKALGEMTTASAPLIQLIKSLNLSQSIKLITDIPLSPLTDLCNLYCGAFWYIQPSLYEGFGLPVLEAQRCGTPVMCSNGGSLPEITGSSALSFIPTETGLRNALNQVLQFSVTERQQYAEKGLVNCKRFSWEKTVKQMISIYEMVKSN